MASLDGLSAGISRSMSIVDDNGIVSVIGIESFNAKPSTPVQKFIQMNGKISLPQFYEGWDGSLVVGRFSSILDSYFAQAEAGYYNGQNQKNITINETITEANGSITQWQYQNCTLTLTDAGTWSGTDIVKQSISFEAARKKQIA